MASCALTIGSPPVWPRSYDKNSEPRKVASDGALSASALEIYKSKNQTKHNNKLMILYILFAITWTK